MKEQSKVQGKTYYWVEYQDAVGEPEWEEKYVGIGALLARGFFLQTPDSGEGVESVPAIVEVDGKFQKWKLDAIKKGLEKTGVEVILFTEEFSATAFESSVAQALLDAYYNRGAQA